MYTNSLNLTSVEIAAMKFSKFKLSDLDFFFVFCSLFYQGNLNFFVLYLSIFRPILLLFEWSFFS